MPTRPDLEHMLREVALRVTRPRGAVLSAVHDPPHADTGTLIGVVRRGSGEVSHQAGYDMLAALTAAGLARRIQPMGSVAAEVIHCGPVSRLCGRPFLPPRAADRRARTARHRQSNTAMDPEQPALRREQRDRGEGPT